MLLLKFFLGLIFICQPFRISMNEANNQESYFTIFLKKVIARITFILGVYII